MKTISLVLLLIHPLAWSQLKEGSVAFLDFAQNEITIAADSRTTKSTGGYEDTECKISAYGNQFASVITGLVKGPGWDAYLLARKIWEAQSVTEKDAVKLVPVVAEQWKTQMEDIYRRPGIVREHRRHNPDGDGTLIGAFFTATNQRGQLAVYHAGVRLDVAKFDTTGTVSFFPKNSGDAPRGYPMVGGLSEIVMEFISQKTERSKAFRAWYATRIAGMTQSQQRAELASKFVELSILLHPRNAELGFPIDVLQLRPVTGVQWIHVKDNCQKQ